MALLNYTGKNVLGVCLKSGTIIRMLPGINEVDDLNLLEMNDHPLFESRKLNGSIIFLTENIGKDGKRSLTEMQNYIPKIFDIKLLKKIIESDGRESIIKLAQKQLDNIKNPSQAKVEQSNEHFG